FEQLELAINTLAHRTDGTDITRALQYGADLLHEHGRPDNDRFLVLITDGAEFRPEGTSSDQIGEVVYVGDPVTVIGQLHRPRGINLHAVGISTPEIFNAWRLRTGTQTRDFQIPNYRGLQDMLDAAGGDRERIGDASVLRECLTSLGRGISRT